MTCSFQLDLKTIELDFELKLKLKFNLRQYYSHYIYADSFRIS